MYAPPPPPSLRKGYAVPLFTTMEAKRAASKKHAAAGAGDMEGFGWHLKLDKQKLPPTAMSQKINGGQSREGEGVDAAKDQSTAGEGEVDMFHLRAWHRKIQKKAYVSSFILKNVGWLSAAAVWCIGTWIILAYGVLIYTYLGAGEEKAFIYAWGMTFVVNNFGFESVAVIWRKVLFI